MSKEVMGYLLFICIMLGLTIVCLFIGKVLSKLSDKVLPDDKE